MTQAGTGAGGERADDPLDALTVKQRAVLDLLIEHKTSKEISRALGISPYTVDQRINLARAKLNLANRGEVAYVYRRLVAAGGRATDERTVCEQSVYEPSYVAAAPISADPGERDDTVAAMPSAVLQLAGTASAIAPEYGPIVATASGGTARAPYYHVLPEMFDGPYGTVLRLAFMVGIALFLMLVALGGMTMFSQLGVMMDR